MRENQYKALSAVPSVRDRLVAFLWDYLLILLYLAALAVVGGGFYLSPLGPAIQGALTNPVVRDLLAFATTILPVLLYFTISESSSAGATWGKRRRGLRVERMSGGRLSVPAALIRSAVKLLPWQIAHTCLFNIPGWPLETGEPPLWIYVGFGLSYALITAYLIALLFGKLRRPLYDHLAVSVVRYAEMNGQ